MNNQELALIRTSFAHDRTFLSLIRTAAIFAGISSLLIKRKKPFISIIILTIAILLNIITTYYFYQHSKKFASVHNPSDAYDITIPITYSIFIIFILLILLVSAILER